MFPLFIIFLTSYQTQKLYKRNNSLINKLENQGQCGNSLFYEIKSDYLLINGTGNMHDYYNKYSLPPWNEEKLLIHTITISEGATSIGSYSFAKCTSIKSLDIPSSVIDINLYAFYYCSNLEHVCYYGNVNPSTSKSIFSNTLLNNLCNNKLFEYHFLWFTSFTDYLSK